MVKIEKIPGEKEICNCYILHNGKEAIVIDPGSDYQIIKKYLKGIRLKAILATHAHYDHIVSVSLLQKEYNAPFYLHSADVKLIKHANLYVKAFGGDKIIEIPKVDYSINEENELNFDFIKIKVMHTPGHTRGSVSFLFENNLFTGDFLLKNKIGRIDFPGGNAEEMKQSVRKINKDLTDVLILPGHDSDSTLDEERKKNKEFIKIINTDN
jgi:hydroxyacylglutathione hydrolase